jgi:hypothetical protein
LAGKKQKSGKPACRVFVFTLPHSRRECTRAHFFISVFIRVISGFILFFPVARCDFLVRRSGYWRLVARESMLDMIARSSFASALMGSVLDGEILHSSFKSSSQSEDSSIS